MTPAIVAALDEREAQYLRLAARLAEWPYPLTQAAAEALAGLWLELRPWLEDGAQMRLFDTEGAA